MNILNAYSRFLNALTKILKAVVCFLLAAMVLIMFYQAMMRYVFSNAQPWCEELTLYIGIFNVMLGLGIARKIVEMHGGSLSLNLNAEGGYTKAFQISFIDHEGD